MSWPSGDVNIGTFSDWSAWEWSPEHGQYCRSRRNRTGGQEVQYSGDDRGEARDPETQQMPWSSAQATHGTWVENDLTDDAQDTLPESFRALSISGPSGSPYAQSSSKQDEYSHSNTYRDIGVTGVQYEPRQDITDPELFERGRFARARIYPRASNQALDPEYKIHPNPDQFFVPGRVIKVPWPDLAGHDDMTAVTRPAKEKVHATTSKFSDLGILEKVRWFIVVKPGWGSCTCLPITTYEKRGVAKKVFVKQHHCIVYTGSKAPSPMIAERQGKGMLPSLRVKPTREGDHMLDQSRLDYHKMYTVEHNVRVYDFGMVVNRQIHGFIDQWRTILDEPWPGNRKTGSSNSSSTHDEHYTQQPRVVQQQYTSKDETPGFATEAYEQPDHATSTVASLGSPLPVYIDYGEANRTYTRPPDQPRQISVAKCDRLSILSWPYEGWAEAYNENSQATGLVALHMITLFRTYRVIHPYSDLTSPGFLTITKGDSVRLLETRGDGWSLVWNQETAQTGFVPTHCIVAA